ncbi:MAG TPA: DUF2442 domain-containing protein [Longimicrobiales bacterium]|nr:DUF2442 domain-containing protein [Longimicrobiales bacterium]
MHHRLVEAEARPRYRLWVRFADGVEGEADLSDVAGRGVFQRWTHHPEEFSQVTVDAESGAPTWPGGLDVAPDRLYVEVARSARTHPERHG